MPSACCCASSVARGARIGTQWCRRSCSNCCGPGGGRGDGAACCCLAVSRPQPGRAAVGPPALPRRPFRRPGRGNQEACVATHAAAQFRHPPPRAGCRYSRDSDTSGPCQTRHHGAVHPRRQYNDPGGNQPPRPARIIDRGEAATRGVARRPCAARSWRSQTSFIAMEPTGAGPMPNISAWVSSRSCRRSSSAAQPLSAGMSSAARIAATAASPTTHVATAIAQSVRARRRRIGWRPARPICCWSAISTWSSHCPPRSLRSPIRTRRSSTTCCSTRRRKRCSLSPPIPSTSARASAPPLCSTAGARHHMIVPGGGISLDGTRWVRCKPGFLLPVRVLSRLFRRLFLAALADAHAAGRLAFFGKIHDLHRREAFAAHLAPLKRKKWFVYTKPPFAGPEAVLAYLARYTHRVAISNSRLVALDERGVTFRYKDYRSGQVRYRTMTLSADEFIRRFLLHVLPKGFHRIRHYGLLASASSKANSRAPGS